MESDGGKVVEAIVAPKRKCAANKGLISTYMLGLLANNLLQVTMANRLAEELCWYVVSRKMWNANWPDPRGRECFPNAILPRTADFSDVQHYSPELEIDEQY
jgi:hypothetical protein